MPIAKTIHKTRITFIFLCCTLICFSQNDKQKELETRRQELRREIQKINELRAENKSKEKSQISLIEGFSYKINVLKNLIKVTNQQANFLNREINNNQKKITDLRDELKALKANYAAMLVKQYKSKNEQSKVMFLLSSENFKQAYKRLQYIKQYGEYQKQQADIIKTKTIELQKINIDLSKQKEEKNKLVAENRVVQRSLEKERKEQEALMASVKRNLSRYTAQIRQKQRAINRIDEEINRIIKSAIAKSNKAAGKLSSSKTFALTAEEKRLASSFTANKGKLPWPVEKGYVSLGYGTQPHPINKNLTIKSSGVRLATEKNAKVRAVFDGEVYIVAQIKNANLYIIVRHGDYFTVYNNLKKVYVKAGDRVTTKQEIGEVFTNPTNGETILRFNLSKNGNSQNPAHWIYRM